MPQTQNKKNSDLKKPSLTPTEIEFLSRKLKLDENNLRLLLDSQGSIKDKSFFEKVSEVMNSHERKS